MTTDSKPSLMMLRDLRTKMTKAPWAVDTEGHCNPRICDGLCGEPDPLSSHHDCGAVVTERGGIRERDAIGIVATHNAADVLIEVVQAALDYADGKATRGDLIHWLDKVNP